MKVTFLQIKLFTYFCCVVALTCTASGQSPTLPPDATSPTAIPDVSVTPAAVAAPSLTPIATPVPVATLAPSVAPSPDTDEDFDKAIERKIQGHLDAAFDGNKSHGFNEENLWWIPLVVFISLFAFFGTPVAVVATIMYFSFSKSRALHKTVRMMVEKGQPVPESLLNPPPIVRQRSDLRRGVVLLMVGAGLMIFFGAVNAWEGGVWSLGIIPFMIGLGYLLVWKLDIHRGESSPKV